MSGAARRGFRARDHGKRLQKLFAEGAFMMYRVHEEVGHLGVFVSSSIAKKEHAEFASTLKAIESLAPGLYEMTIDEATGEGSHARFAVYFHERKKLRHSHH